MASVGRKTDQAGKGECMNLDFNADRWAQCREAHRRWWDGNLGRPLLNLSVVGRDPGRPHPNIPRHAFHSFYAPDIAPAQIADALAWRIESCYYLGDGFPHVWINFGPGVIAAFLGLDLVNGENTVWFHARDRRPIRDIDFHFDPQNPTFLRVCAIARACVERFEGQAQIGMTDLGGNLDILSSFRPGEGLLLDLYDEPEEVKRLTDRAHDMWWRYFEEINAILRPANPGYTSWTPLFSETPSYMLQCDFSYMIGPAMFREFVRPELQRTCERLDHAFYHLDGPGQLPHLDDLLSINALRGVQWVPGAGQPPISAWPEVYRKIVNSGKRAQFYAQQDPLGIAALDALAERAERPEYFCLIGGDLPAAQHEQARTAVERWVKR